ncbi:Armadillo/beta-catenin-like repeat [Phytophthora infestans]|uniref:Importin subunit alpha n=1 Tax=Phytophthora infestans TaxID=4787 RepID=A0A833W7E6_PHYIN|nr:Armadillo/beta-catenin-like repeat [Phytophthora infestans]
MPPRTPRSSLKKHDAAAESRALKARRQRTTAQVRKDKRRAAVQTKRRRLMSAEQPPLTNRSIAELVRVLGDTSNASATQSQARFETLKEIRVLLASHENDYEQVEQIIESGIVPVMVSLLNSASPLASATRTGGEVYREILWCLTNIASGQYEHTKLVLPAVPRLLQFLEGSNHSLAEHSAWVLGNIAADCEEFRQQLIANGAVLPLVKLLSNPKEKELAKTSAWALSNLARGFETSAKPFVDAGLVPVVVKGLSQPPCSATFSEDIVVEVVWLLSFLTAREDEYLKLMLENGLVDLLVPYFSTTNELLLTPILRVFGNICCGSPDHHTDEWQLPFVRRLVRADSVVLPKLSEFLQPQQAGTQQKSLAAEAAWVVSNLAAAEASVVDLVMQTQLLPLLGRQFKDGSYEVRREVAFALTNIALTSAAHMEKVLALDVLKGFLHLLTVADVAIVGNSLRFIENVLRVATHGVSLVEVNEGIDALETVQFECGEEHLSKWAAALVNEFYGENYGVNSPPSAGGVSGFNFPTGEPVQFQLGGQQQPAGPGGRGRGAHMTTPAWKK